MLTDIDIKKSQKSSCIVCHYSTSRKSNYEKHLLTAKHKMLTHIDKNATFVASKSSNLFECLECDYKTSKNNDFKKHLLTKNTYW